MKTALLTTALLLSLCAASCIGLSCALYHRAPLYLYAQASGRVTESLIIIRASWAESWSAGAPRLFAAVEDLAGLGLALRDVVLPAGERTLDDVGDVPAFAAAVRRLQPAAVWTTAYSGNLTSADITYYNGMATVGHSAR